METFSLREVIMYYCCGITDKGIMKHNEDAYMIDGKVITEGNIDFMVKAPFIAAVSDGVSGENYGEIASKKMSGIFKSDRF